jgi:hypothetical protein
MTARPKFNASRLREIGWSLWDPIGLNYRDGRPGSEYDAYLFQAAGKLWIGATEQEVSEYLVGVEFDVLRLGHRAGAQERARRTILALAEYAAELRD